MSVVTIVIPHYNGVEIIKQCLDSLMVQTYTQYSIVVVDNGSTDGSVDMITRDFSDTVTVIKLGSNTGFAYAVNTGIKVALEQASEFVFVLNNDTVLEHNCLELLVSALQKNSNVGAVQPKILNASHPDRIDSMGIVITRDMSAMNRNQSNLVAQTTNKDEEVFGVTACAALYRLSALTACSLSTYEYFDNSYFAYYEDVDLAFRMRYLGYESWCISNALLFHHHSVTGVNYSAFKSFHIHRNHLYNVIKDMPAPLVYSMIWRVPARYFLLVSSVLKKQGPSHRLQQGVGKTAMIKLVMRSWKDFFWHLPKLLQQRRKIMTQRKVSLRTARGWFDQFGISIDKTVYEERI